MGIPGVDQSVGPGQVGGNMDVRDIAEGAASTDPDVGLRAVAALRGGSRSAGEELDEGAG